MRSESSIATSGIWTGQITVPSSGTASGTLLLTLLKAALYPGPDDCLVTILGQTPAGSRPALLIGTKRKDAATFAATDLTTHGRPIAADADYISVCDKAPSMMSIRAVGGSDVPANVEVVW